MIAERGFQDTLGPARSSTNPRPLKGVGERGPEPMYEPIRIARGEGLVSAIRGTDDDEPG